MKLYVGNLPFSTGEDQLGNLFGSVGTVTSARIITDQDTGRPRGFGFVEMSTESEAKAAIERFNGYQLDGRSLVVNEARAREEGPRRSGGGGRNRY
jgi:RNA recognition motif-containing protein